MEESLSVSNCALLTEFPDDMDVGRDVRISEMEITGLPKGFTVKGDLTIEDCPDLKALPEGLVVYGRMEISNTGIRTLPDDAIFGGDVILRGPSFETLPDGLTVSGDLDIRGTGIRTLPENMVIGGRLDIMDLPVTELPGSLKVGYRVISSLEKTSSIGLRSDDYEPGRYIPSNRGLTHVKEHFLSDGKDMIRAQGEEPARRGLFRRKTERSGRRRGKAYRYHYYTGKIPGRNAISDGGCCLECTSLRDGIFELTYQRRQWDGRGIGQYSNVTMDTVLPTDEMAAMYRYLTGDVLGEARKKFSAMQDLKESYSVREFAELTKGWRDAERFTGFINRDRPGRTEGKEGSL